jgi:hypothetical protein
MPRSHHHHQQASKPEIKATTYQGCAGFAFRFSPIFVNFGVLSFVFRLSLFGRKGEKRMLALGN